MKFQELQHKEDTDEGVVDVFASSKAAVEDALDGDTANGGAATERKDGNDALSGILVSLTRSIL